MAPLTSSFNSSYGHNCYYINKTRSLLLTNHISINLFIILIQPYMIHQLQQQIELYGTYLNAKNNQLPTSQPIVINNSGAVATAVGNRWV